MQSSDGINWFTAVVTHIVIRKSEHLILYYGLNGVLNVTSMCVIIFHTDDMVASVSVKIHWDSAQMWDGDSSLAGCVFQGHGMVVV